MMAVKSSENENKVLAMTLKRPCKSDPNTVRVLRGHPFAWKRGRGEVAW